VNIKLNAALVLNGDVSTFEVIPDSTGVVYLADQDSDGIAELYRATLGGGNTKINPPILTAGRAVLAFTVTSNGSSVIYRANQDSTNIVELFRTFFASVGASTKLNSGLAVGEDVTDFAVR
jgi:hypothetical protein